MNIASQTGVAPALCLSQPDCTRWLSRWICLGIIWVTAFVGRAQDRSTTPPKETPEVQRWLDLSQAAFRKGELTNALGYANRAVEANAKSVAAYYARARINDANHQPLKAVADYSRVLDLDWNATGVYQRRGEANFRAGRFEASVADFDQFLRRVPREAPQHWQRGISLYYAKRYELGRRQFEVHQKVNPEDVENAAWHFLCVARLSGVEAARKALIPITQDSRVPMMTIYALYAGKATVAEVFAAARVGEPSPGELEQRLFYANLYVGLYEEVTGQETSSREHILKAASMKADHYMGDVARVHAALLAGQANKDGN